MRDSLLLSKPVIQAAAANPDLLRRFPFLRNAAAQVPGKACCGGVVRPELEEARWNNVKTAVASLSGDKAREFARALNTKQIVIKIVSNGRMKTYTVGS